MDISRAEGELCCPVAGEGQCVTVTQARAVEAVGRLVTFLFVYRDVEGTDIEVDAEEVTLRATV